MMKSNSGRGLMWVHWRSRRGTLLLLFAVALAMIASPWWGDYVWGTWTEAHAFELAAFFSVLVLGATLFSRHELDPTRSFLLTLPVRRRKILFDRLVGLAIYVCCLVLLYLAIIAYSKGRDFDMVSHIALYAAMGVFMAPVALLAVILSLHSRSTVVTVALSAAAAIPLALIVFIDLGTASEFEFRYRETVCGLAATAVLVAWLYILFCRTPLLELRDGARGLLALLFIVVALEFFFTLFLCDWRDLAFLVFGV